MQANFVYQEEGAEVSPRTRAWLERTNKVSELIMDYDYAWEDLETMNDTQIAMFYSLATLMRRTPDVQDFIDRMLNDQRRLRYHLMWTDSDEEWFREQHQWECGTCNSTKASDTQEDQILDDVHVLN